MVVPIDLKDKLRQFDAHWSPKRVAGFNGYDIMVVKAQGDFNWHVHEETDDFFWCCQARSQSTFGIGTCKWKLASYTSFLPGSSIGHLLPTKHTYYLLSRLAHQTPAIRLRQQWSKKSEQ